MPTTTLSNNEKPAPVPGEVQVKTIPIDPIIQTSGTVAEQKETGGAQADSGPTPQQFRILVPTASTEIVLGLSDDGQLGARLKTSHDVSRTSKSHGVTLPAFDDVHVNASSMVALGVNEQGFVGVLTTVDHGNVAICATGAANLGSSYEQVMRTSEIILTGVGLVKAGLTLWSKTYYGKETGSFSQGLAAKEVIWSLLNFGASSAAGGSGGGLGDIDYLKTGNVSIFGAHSVKLDSVEGVSTSAALFNSHTGGLSASLSSVISASVSSGALASVTGAFSASLSGNSASVNGFGNASLAARTGVAKVNGQTIRIGSKETAQTWKDGAQEATTDLWMRANNFIEVGVPSGAEFPVNPAASGHLGGLMGTPTGLQIIQGIVRLDTPDAALRLGMGQVSAIAGKSLFNVGQTQITLGRALLPPHEATTAALDAARAIFHTAYTAADGLGDQVGKVTNKLLDTGTKTAMAVSIASLVAVAAGAAAVGAGAGAAMGAEAGSVNGGKEDGTKIGAIAGAVVGGVGILAVIGAVMMKAAGKAQKDAQRVARELYLKAVNTALNAELLTGRPSPIGPQIQVSDSGVTLSVGPTASIQITKAGVVIKGLKVTVNDIDMLPPSVPATPAPPPIPPRPNKIAFIDALPIPTPPLPVAG